MIDRVYDGPLKQRITSYFRQVTNNTCVKFKRKSIEIKKTTATRKIAYPQLQSVHVYTTKSGQGYGV